MRFIMASPLPRRLGVNEVIPMRPLPSVGQQWQVGPPLRFEDWVSISVYSTGTHRAAAGEHGSEPPRRQCGGSSRCQWHTLQRGTVLPTPTPWPTRRQPDVHGLGPGETGGHTAIVRVLKMCGVHAPVSRGRAPRRSDLSEPFASFATASAQHTTPSLGAIAFQETAPAAATDFRRLIGSFH